MDIIETINIINETYESIYDDFKSDYMYSSAELTFTNGFCFEFYNLLKRFFPKTELVMSDDRYHCAALIDGEVYDTTGLRDDSYRFHVATGCDMEYIFKYYGFFSGGLKETLIKEVTKNVFNNKKIYAKTLTKRV